MSAILPALRSAIQPAIRSALASSGAAVWSPLTLFAASEVGVWYDPSDFSTMYQDSAGTTPVTAVGQPVGLILDKSKWLVLGSEVVTNGTFDTNFTGWTNVNGNTGTSSVIAGEFNIVTGGGGSGGFTQDISVTAGVTYKVSITARKISGAGSSRAQLYDGPSFANMIKQVFDVSSPSGELTYVTYVRTSITSILRVYLYADTNTTTGVKLVSVMAISGNHASQATAASRPILGRTPATGQRNLLLATDTMATQNATVTAVAHTLSFNGTGTVTLTGTSTAGPLVGTGAGNRVSLTFTPTAGTLTLTVSGSVTFAQLETGSTATAYQKVTAAYDVTEAGVADRYNLYFDGVDDSLATAAIDFTGTDAVGVFAGIRKSSDAARGTIVELTASAAANNGAFHLAAPNAASATIAFESKGTVLADAVAASGVAAPITAVLTGTSDISGDTAILRVNGAQADADTGDQGTGNFSNAVLYIGRRGGSSLPFKGSLHSLTVLGRTLTAGEIASAESYAAGKSGVTL